MTIRVRPVDRGRSTRDPNRRTFYMNLAFGITVVVAILILAGVGVTTWYGAHLAAAATVDGQTITKDQFVERATVEAFRLQQVAARVKADVDAGRLTAAEGQSRIDALNNQLDDSSGAFSQTIVEKLIDTALQAKLAAGLGVTVTPEQIDARALEDKTREEERHVWVISVAPELDKGKTDPTDAQKAAAKKKADDALAAIKGGKTFEEEAKAVSGDASATNGGDLGWMDTSASEDPDWQAAVFKLEPNALTDVILGADGTYRIGRVTDIAPAQVDQTWDQKLADAKISVAAYRAAVGSEVMRTVLGDRIVADASASGPQKQVQELYIKAPRRPRPTARSRSATSCSRRRTTPVARPRSRRPTRTGRRPSSRRGPPTTRSRPTPSSSTSSPGPRATRPRTSGMTGPAGSCRTTAPTARSTRRSRPRSSRTASRRAISSSRSRARSAGTSSR